MEKQSAQFVLDEKIATVTLSTPRVYVEGELERELPKALPRNQWAAALREALEKDGIAVDEKRLPEIAYNCERLCRALVLTHKNPTP